MRADSLIGCILGTAVGDAIGLPAEGLSRRRQRRMLGEIDGHRLLFGRGMISDDTEHTCMTAQALIVSGGEPDAFVRSLAWRLRFWLLGLPAGTGKATLKSFVKLWLGFPARKSGVWSAGNGPAMRSALIGVCFGDDPQRLRKLVRLSTRITHTDPRAEQGALAVALAAHMASRQGEKPLASEEYEERLRELLGTDEASEFLGLIERTIESVRAGESVEAFFDNMGLTYGASGFICHTIPAVIHVWLRHQGDFREGIREIVRLGGDTDTTAAILGAIVGARVGRAGIPDEWLDGLFEWPRSVAWMERLGHRLAAVMESGKTQPPLRLFVPALVARNLLFFLVVLIHGFRRMLPPY